MWSALSQVILLSSVISAQDVRMPPYVIAQDTKLDRFDKIYRNEETIELECKAAGVPTPEYTWIKNGASLNLNTPGISRLTDGSISIAEAGSRDQGYYQCQASNMYGKTISMTYVLKRAVLDPGTSSEVTVTATEGESVKLTANPPKSYPKPTYSWELATSKVDDKPTALAMSQRILMDDFGNLWFTYVTKEDSFNGAKIYKSTVYNSNLDIKSGGSYTNLTVLAGGLKEYRPVVKFSPQTPLIAVEKRTVEMKCIFSGYPEPVVQWSRPPGHSLPLGRHKIDDSGAKITISNVSSADEGDYICSANNRNGRDEKTTQISVQSAPEFRSPVAGPHNKNVTEGEDFVVNCDAYAKPDAKVEWFLNAENLNLAELPPKFSVSSNHKTLTVRSVCRDCPPGDNQRSTDLMVIQCNASNVHGYAFGSGYLNVLLPSKATLVSGDGHGPDVDIDTKSEKTLRYECNAESDPSTPVTPKWYNITNPDKVEVLHSEPPEITVTGGILNIQIAENTTAKWHSRTRQYKCVVDNGYNKAEQVVTITAVDKPMPAPVVASFEWWWLILLIVFILFLIFILILCCCLYLMRNKGDKYDVDEKERQNGNDPVKELTDKDFQDYKRPDERGMKGSQGSMASLCASSVKLNSDEEASLNDYGDDPGRFAEDGSFLGVYTGDQK